MPDPKDTQPIIIVTQTGCCPGVTRYTCGVIWACLGVLDIIGGVITAVVPSSDPASGTVAWVTNIIVGIVIVALAWALALRHGPGPTTHHVEYKHIAQKEPMPGQLVIGTLMSRLDTSIC
jgi:hypothetical protein